MIYKKIISTVKYFHISFLRLIDHGYRWSTGRPILRNSQITPNLFIGGQYKVSALVLFRKIGITLIVNMRISSEIKDENEAPIKVLHLPTKDFTAPTIEDFKIGVTEITKEIQAGGKVYVHCHWGEGRGASMGIAYLVSTGLTLEDAIKMVRNIRKFISLTTVQFERLKEFETICHSLEHRDPVNNQVY